MADTMAFRKRKVMSGKSPYGMVSTASRIATEAGVTMLEKGGNAIDAAVAAAFCLCVTEPQASGIGGQSMFLVHLKDGKAFALDGSSRAPFAVVPGHFSHHHPLKLGIEATTVPSTPAALGYALEAYGSLPLKDVLEPAINAAKKGFKVTALQHRLLSQASEALLRDERAKEIFFEGDQPLGAGQLLKQPQLAALLERLASFGWRDFYTGEIGEKS
jgi:gamma-glutamyltranspeptidase / glutathione hydrolase